MIDLIKIRQDLHRIPELGFEEFKTTAYLSSILEGINEITIYYFDFPGVLAVYSRGNGSYKLFRADMDALPISEKTNCSFSSRHSGKMHACGHDVHMTILLGLIDKVVHKRIKENLLFLFQPAEEGMGGAERILKTGILDRFKISNAFALHVSGSLPVGTISTKPGIFFANTQEIEMKITGKSAHVAFPEHGRNALAAGAEFYLEIQKIVKSEFDRSDPVVCEFGKMRAGTVMNAIAAECTLEGTMRAFTLKNMKRIRKYIEELSLTLNKKYDVQFQQIYKSFYKQVTNESALYEKLKSIAADSGYDFVEADAVFTGEDFGYYAEKYTGLLFWLGANQGEKQNLHSPNFLPSEKSIEIGVDLLYKMI
ncbi:MAG: hypothetical protein DRI23_07920 [Candidatus Cloacimonadota bacterium]|nr:MAG: hypothetical protein DRI23_07920 [Candidatus Cloacimonadota bacterium]